MITEGTGWPAAREFAIAGDHKHHYTGYASAGVTLTQAVGDSDTTVYISNVDLTGKGSRLEIGGDEKDEKVIGELMLVTDVLKSVLVTRGSNSASHDAKSAIEGPNGVIEGLFVSKALDGSATEVFVNNTSKLKAGETIKIGAESVTIKEVTQPRVTVTRHLGTTKAAAHAEGAAVWLAPVPPDPAPITQPACGQNLPAAVPTPGAVAASANLKLVAQGTAWDTEKLLGIAGQELTLSYDNKDAGIAHNIHIFANKDASGDAVIQSEIAPGPETLTLKFGPLVAGDYYYQCDIHPGQMSGTLSVVAAGSAPAASSSPAASTTPAASATP
jgi:plastocyanin